MRALIWCLAVAGLISRSMAADASKSMLELRVGNERVEGMPLAWSRDRVYLLARDGRLWDFSPNSARDFHKIPGVFSSYSAGAMRGQLQAELGRGYEVTGTGRYLVAHPAGQKNLWANRFEELYRSFVHYFSVRGFRVKDPEFPLVAIVFPDQASFMRYAANDGQRPAPNVLGYYSPLTNRIALYDQQVSDSDWHQNAETIIHEATHQTAFNTGIHSRFADQPRWAVEGLAMLFEAQGVFSSRQHPNQRDRINRGQLETFRRYQKSGRPQDSLVQLISSDRRFQSDMQNAYAEAWALSFYLVETQPRKYAEYLQHLASIQPFEDRSSAQRVEDFAAVFGNNFALFEAQFQRFMRDLK